MKPNQPIDSVARANLKKSINQATPVLLGVFIAILQGCSDGGPQTAEDSDSITEPDATEPDASERETAGPIDTASDSVPLSDSAAKDTSTDSVVNTEDCWKSEDDLTTLVFVNHCDKSLNVNGSDMEPALLLPGETVCRHIGSATEAISSVRYWGFIGSDPGGEHFTLAEMTLNTDFYDFDWYNISHVDAHNLPMAIVPLEMPDCPSLVCEKNLLPDCPEEGRFYLEGQLVSCVSPDRNNPDSVIAQYFENGCEDAYSWSGDDAESMAACAVEDYAITFCP